MDLIEKKITLGILKEWRETFAEYEAQVEQNHKNGYIAHYCVHGVDMWTDYDAICGPCEHGYGYFDYLEYLDLSRNRAKELVEQFHKDIANAQKVRELARDAGAYAELGVETEALVKKMLELAWGKLERFFPKK